MGASITIHKELLEAISFKFPDLIEKDDTAWPSEPLGTNQPKANGITRPSARNLFATIEDDSDDEDWVKDPLVLARWAARVGLNAPEDVSKPLDPMYPEYAGYWFLSDLDDCEKSCCRPV